MLTFNRRIGSAADVTDKLGFTDGLTPVEVEPELVGAIGATLTGVSEDIAVQFDSTDGLVAVYTYKTKGTVNASTGKLSDVTFAAKAS